MSELKIGDHVRVVADGVTPENIGRTGRVTALHAGPTWPIEVEFDEGCYDVFTLKELEPVEASALDESGPKLPENTEDAAPPQRVSDVDKLRLLAAVVDAQAPFGTDLADFKRRLQIVLGL